MMVDRERIREITERAEVRGQRIMRERDEAWKARLEHVGAAPVSSAAIESLSMPPPRSTVADAGLLVAEGDSWFDYPGADVLEILEDTYGYVVEDVAHRGDRVESMAYEDGQLRGFTRLLDRVLRRGETPKAILLSGGGNDIAGEEFRLLLDHAQSYSPGINEQIVAGVIDQRLMDAYLSIIASVHAVCRFRLNREVPIIIHGYGHAVPDGRGFLGGLWPLPGPWLKPGFRAKGYGDQTANAAVIEGLIDRFNTMLQRVVGVFPVGSVQYVDLRPLLPNTPSEYKSWWADELHPTPAGFRRVVAAIAHAIESA